MQAFLFFVTLISIFNISSIISYSILDKKNEIFILITQGIRKVKIIKIFFIQGFVIGIFGVLLGIIIGIFLSKNTSLIFITTENFYVYPTIIKYSQIFRIFIIFTIVIILSIMYPCYITNKIKLIKSL